MGTNKKYIIQHQKGVSIIKNYVILTYMRIIDPSIVWFKIVKFPCFDLDKVANRNNEYTDKLSAGVNQPVIKMWICRYLLTHKIVFGNGS